MLTSLRKNSGAILILALWTMSFLTIFAAYVGLRVRQRASLLSRIEERSQLRFLAESGVRKSIAVLKKEMNSSAGLWTAATKQTLFNNLPDFSSIPVGQGEFSVYVGIKEHTLGTKVFGVTDEERKINLNRADAKTMQRLFETVAGLKEDKAESLASAMIDWRELHSNELTGFSSENYYANLKSPYESKRAEFELFDEVRLVKGMTREIFDQIFPYITIFGDGQVNINTAPREVLFALGMENSLIEKIFLARRGVDHEEATADDYIFQKTFDIVSELRNFIDIQSFEAEQIDKLNQDMKLKTTSTFYRIESYGLFRREKQPIKVTCIYNQTDQWIEYWSEK
jgi:type II secretory pathway component PulK